MKLSTNFWVITILLLIAIGEGIYIYYTRPKPSATTQELIAAKRSLDSVIFSKDSLKFELTQRINYWTSLYDDVYEQNQGLRETTHQVGKEVGELSDSLDYYREKVDTPRFVMACDSLQVKADSLVERTVKLDSMRVVSDNLIWVVGRQKDSVNDVLQQEVFKLKTYDSTISKQIIANGVASDKQAKKDSFLKKLYIGLGIAATVAAAIFVK